MATPEAIDFLVAVGAHKAKTANGVLISVDTAVKACEKAGWGAPLLAALAGVAELQPHTAHLLPLSQHLLATPSGRHACLPCFPQSQDGRRYLMSGQHALQGAAHLPMSSSWGHAAYLIMMVRA